MALLARLQPGRDLDISMLAPQHMWSVCAEFHSPPRGVRVMAPVCVRAATDSVPTTCLRGDQCPPPSRSGHVAPLYVTLRQARGIQLEMTVTSVPRRRSA